MQQPVQQPGSSQYSHQGGCKVLTGVARCRMLLFGVTRCLLVLFGVARCHLLLFGRCCGVVPGSYQHHPLTHDKKSHKY